MVTRLTVENLLFNNSSRMMMARTLNNYSRLIMSGLVSVDLLSVGWLMIVGYLSFNSNARMMVARGLNNHSGLMMMEIALNYLR